jgi:hypothetical protein
VDTAALDGELKGVSGRVTAIETRLAALDPTGAGGAISASLQAEIAGADSSEDEETTELIQDSTKNNKT